MIRLVTELTNAELTRRIHKIEEYEHKLQVELSNILTAYKRDILFNKRRVLLIRYAEAVHEAAYRDLLTIH